MHPRDTRQRHAALRLGLSRIRMLEGLGPCPGSLGTPMRVAQVRIAREN